MQEFHEWVAYYQIEPWGEERADWRSAMVAFTMASLWAGKGRRPKFGDFLPTFHKPKQSNDDINAIFIQAAKAAKAAKGHKDLDGEHNRKTVGDVDAELGEVQ